jgi:hypothetical protein
MESISPLRRLRQQVEGMKGSDSSALRHMAGEDFDRGAESCCRIHARLPLRPAVGLAAGLLSGDSLLPPLSRQETCESLFEGSRSRGAPKS